jgi:hypothetical protein
MEEKEALKKLRETRKQTIRTATARMKERRKAIRAIREQLKANGQTVPEIAQGTGLKTSEVLWMVATLKKYGQILEGEKEGSYFKYRLSKDSSAPGGDEDLSEG